MSESTEHITGMAFTVARGTLTSDKTKDQYDNCFQLSVSEDSPITGVVAPKETEAGEKLRDRWATVEVSTEQKEQFLDDLMEAYYARL